MVYDYYSSMEVMFIVRAGTALARVPPGSFFGLVFFIVDDPVHHFSFAINLTDLARMKPLMP